MMTMPFARRMSSAPAVIGPLAASMIRGALDAVGVAEVDDRFHRRGDQDVALVLEHRGAVLDVGAAGEVLDPAVGVDVGLEELDRQALLVQHGAVALDDAR